MSAALKVTPRLRRFVVSAVVATGLTVQMVMSSRSSGATSIAPATPATPTTLVVPVTAYTSITSCDVTFSTSDLTEDDTVTITSVFNGPGIGSMRIGADGLGPEFASVLVDSDLIGGLTAASVADLRATLSMAFGAHTMDFYAVTSSGAATGDPLCRVPYRLSGSTPAPGLARSIDLQRGARGTAYDSGRLELPDLSDRYVVLRCDLVAATHDAGVGVGAFGGDGGNGGAGAVGGNASSGGNGGSGALLGGTVGAGGNGGAGAVGGNGGNGGSAGLLSGAAVGGNGGNGGAGAYLGDPVGAGGNGGNGAIGGNAGSGENGGNGALLGGTLGAGGNGGAGGSYGGGIQLTQSSDLLSSELVDTGLHFFHADLADDAGPSCGRLSGTPTKAGTYTLTMRLLYRHAHSPATERAPASTTATIGVEQQAFATFARLTLVVEEAPRFTG